MGRDNKEKIKLYKKYLLKQIFIVINLLWKSALLFNI